MSVQRHQKPNEARSVGLLREAKDFYSDISTYARKRISQSFPTAVRLDISKDRSIEMTIDLKRGMNNSYTAVQQSEEIAMSPYMRNALLKFSDIKDGQRLTIYDPVTKAELYIQNKVKKGLLAINGPKALEYDKSLDCLDKRHYNVDCWRNFHTGTDMRFIQPGQDDQRKQVFATFASLPPSTPTIFNDRDVGIALSNVLDDMPHNIVASNEFKDWTGPFQNKKTQTSYPFFYRDDVIVSEETDPTKQLGQFYGSTFGQMCVEIAKHTDLDHTLDYAVSVAYARDRRKGRGIIAMSRIPAVAYNRLTSVETMRCQSECSFMVGYNGRDVLRDAMVKQANFAVENGFAMENFDYHAFDTTISPEWLGLGAWVWNHLAADSVGKSIAYYRGVYNLKNWLICGFWKYPELIYGRMLSGFIETNKTENVINAVASTASILKQDNQWINKVQRRCQYSRMYMGDDCLITYRPDYFDHDTYVKDIATYGFEVHKDKGEFGAFFLQNRLFRDQDGYTFTYPWTRVLNSILFKENSVGLGPAGWTLACYSQLANIREFKKGLACVRDIILEFDEQKLMLDIDIKDIIKQVQEEDKKALEENKRATSTWDIINDGDPGKHHITSSESNYLKELQADIKSATW